MEDEGTELVIPTEEEEETKQEKTKKRVVWKEEEEEEGKGFSQLDLFGDDFRPCSVSLAHFNFANIYQILYNNKKFVDYEVCDPLGIIGTHKLQAVLSTKNDNKSHRSKTKTLLDPSHDNFQPVHYLKSLHKHTNWNDLKRGRDLLQGETSKDLLERKHALINDYFEQFVTCHDTMQEVCGKLHNELSDATGNINGLVKSYEGMVAQAVMLKRRGREKEKERMTVGSPMMNNRRKRSASVCSTPFEVPFSSSLVLSGSVAGLTEDFSAYLQSLASSSSLSSSSTTSLLNNNSFYNNTNSNNNNNNNSNSNNNNNNKFNPLSTSPTFHTTPPPIEDKTNSQSCLPSLSSLSSIFPEILEEAGTDVIAHKLTDRVVGLVPKNKKKGGLVYHNVFRGKDVQKWVKSRITPFNDAATSVCQAMVQDGHLVKLRSSRRTSIPFIQDDHDFYALVSKNSSPIHSPHDPSSSSPPLSVSVSSSVASSPALSHRALHSSSAAVVDVAHSLGLPDFAVTPDVSPLSTPLPSPPSTPKLSSNNHNNHSSSLSSYPLPPTSTTKATQMKTAIASFCTQISLAIDNEIQNTENPLPELEKAVKNIGNCFDTIYNINSHDITSATQLKKGITLLSEVMEKVVRIYTEKAGEICIENSTNGINLNAQGEEITTVLNANIRPTLSSIYRVINSATMHLNPTSPHASRTPSFSSLAYTWFFESFLIGCDLIHQSFTQCNGLSSQEGEIEDAWLYEGEGWKRGSYRRWDEKGNATGWVELVVECDKLAAEFERMYPRFEKVHRPVTFEMQEKAAQVVDTIKALEGLISAKYMRYHSLKLREIAQCLFEDDENDTDLDIVSNKFASMRAQQPISADVEIKQEELMRSYLHGVLQHMMVVHMETLSLSKSFRRQTVQDLLSPILFQIRRSEPSRQASVEYAVLLRVINGKDEDIRDSAVFDETTDDNSNNSSPTQSDTASVHSHASSTLSLKETKPKNKSLFKKSKSKKKKSKPSEQETVWVSRKIPTSSFANQPPPRSRKFTLSTHRLADLSNYRMVPETPINANTVDSHIKEDYEKAINLVSMVLECLDADC